MFIIADDFSGCTDAQVQLLPFGLSAVSVLPRKGFAPFLGKHDCLILDNEARAGTPETAYNNTRQMVESIPLAGETIFKKIDSTFRGNMGAELDALSDFLELRLCPVVCSYPANGRTTVGGELFVDGQRISETSFAHDPHYPMTNSRLREVLAGQTKKSVGEIGLTTVRQGPRAMVTAIVNSDCAYLILDAETEDDLNAIGQAVIDLSLPVLAGSAAMLRAYVSNRFETRPAAEQTGCLDSSVLVISGSLHEKSACQAERLAGEYGLQSVTLSSENKQIKQELIAQARNHSVVLAETPRERLDGTESDFEAVFGPVCDAIHEAGIQNLFLTGGWTALSVAEGLDIEGVSVEQEVEPGIALCRSVGGPTDYRLAIKPGGFGSDEVMVKAARMLLRQGQASWGM
jgi:uncharacterized protein YgbK (DUF1537 family)